MTDTPKTPSFLGENTILKLQIPKEIQHSTYKEVLASYQSRMTLPGFRKGKAPLNLVESRIGHDELVQAVVEKAAPKIYAQEVDAQKLAPLTPPQVRILAHPADGNWEIEAHVGLAPQVSLGDWKKVVKDAGKEIVKAVKTEAPVMKPAETAHDHHDHDGHDHGAKSHETAQLTTIFQKLIEAINPKVAPILIEYEASQRVNNFVNDLRRHNIELTEYLTHNGLTPEQFEEEILSTTVASRQLESILLEITADLKITASEDDIKQFLGDTSKFSPQAIERLSGDARAIIVRRKTIDEIKKLAGISDTTLTKSPKKNS